MIQDILREQSAAAHQQLEKIVVTRLKAIKSQADYASILKQFFGYFNRLEYAIAPFITTAVLPDKDQRRNPGYLENDIIALGENTNAIPIPEIPEISNLYQALGALYVMEGSIIGGGIIVQMLAKLGITEGTSFFSGYGQDTLPMWNRFIEALNTNIPSSEQYQTVETAIDTFHCFALSFNEN